MSGVWMRSVRALWTIGASIALVCGVSVSSWAVYDSGFDPGQSQGAYVAESGVNNVIQIPDSGVLHYDSFTVPDGVTVTFTKNADNTGVWILTGGDIVIDGEVDLAGSINGNSGHGVDKMYHSGGYAGPGGSDGGLTLDTAEFGADGTLGQRGLGPGGGGMFPQGTNDGMDGASALHGPDKPEEATAWADPAWIPLSGGGGGAAYPDQRTYRGGGGGGLITLASNSVISVEGTIDVRPGGSFGYGAGGGIRLIADTISGSGTLDLDYGTGGTGFARLEALFFEGQLINNINPDQYEPVIATPQVALPYPEAARPRLEIATVNGQGPAHVRGDWPPNSIVTTGVSVEVHIEAEYMPVGVPGLVVRMNPAGGDAIVIDDAVLSGAVESSSATVTFVLPAGIRVGTFEAWWVEPLPITN